MLITFTCKSTKHRIRGRLFSLVVTGGVFSSYNDIARAWNSHYRTVAPRAEMVSSCLRILRTEGLIEFTPYKGWHLPGSLYLN